MAETKPVQRAEPQPHKGKPTPTQAENDAVAMGTFEGPLEDDGSGPDPNVAEPKEKTKDMGSKPSGGQDYRTRQSTPAKHE